MNIKPNIDFKVSWLTCQSAFRAGWKSDDFSLSAKDKNTRMVSPGSAIRVSVILRMHGCDDRRQDNSRSSSRAVSHKSIFRFS